MNPRLLRPTSSTLDADAAVYLNAVAQADGQQLEPAVRKAINDFVVGCKRDNIWSAIKASCILAGARTLTGALTPLRGSAPTNNGPFVSGDYDRKTGLVGNGTSKYLDTNRNANADPQDNAHMAVYLGAVSSTTQMAMGAGGASTGATQMQGGQWRNRSGTGDNFSSIGNQSGLFAMSRSSSSAFIGRNNGTSTTYTRTSQTPFNGNIFTHARNSSGSAGLHSAMRVSYYSIGESLDLALLDSRVSTLMNAIGAAIP
jgi:hypothetical protein